MRDSGSVKMSHGKYVYFEKNSQEPTYTSYVMVPKNGNIVLSKDVEDIKIYIEWWEQHMKKVGGYINV